ncbi:hypothetical protein E3T46_06200 [Cryobacterium sp. Hh11]|uniref:hypothetical protein n=1 Tax=Cryobacterium sp. Hh11 TaxID=2555868 RepID=UPI001069E167|nr:hypothetical protein [Cryobacterium sp. Hh11]TFD52449.1 hypothetical protein E3T46_06200 [Cryobacterium sp. Hh11]
MHLAPGAKSKPPDDAARLALFGPPVFGFVPQRRIQERGWSWYGNHGRTLEAQAHYWLADPAEISGSRIRRPARSASPNCADSSSLTCRVQQIGAETPFVMHSTNTCNTS